MNTTRDGQLARLSPAALRKDGGACGGGQLRASAHAVSGQALWCKTNGCVLSNGLRGKQDIRLLKRCPSGGPIGPVILFLPLRPGLKRFRD